jgi:ubiquitin C-terminal hydrolase
MKGEVNGQPPNPSSSQSSYLATLENRINVVETQNQNLHLRITMLEKKVQDLMKPSLNLPSFSMGSSSVIDPIIGLTTFPYRSRGEQKNRTVTTHEHMLTRLGMPNSGLKNSGVLCYSNAIFQALASCYQRTTLFKDPIPTPKQDHDRFRLCYAFAEVLHLLVNRQLSEQDVLDPTNFSHVFQEIHSDYIDEESEYC